MMSDSEAIEVVHRMMDARDQEMARKAKAQASVKKERAFWRKALHEVAVYGTGLLGYIVFALLMAVLQ